MEGTLIKADGTEENIDVVDFKHAQKLVGGYIEVVPSRIGNKSLNLKTICLVDEDGYSKGLPFNQNASARMITPLVGNALFISKKILSK